ncbi:peptidase metallopeptidase [Solidesulfovibrio carbinoliphilus subsp. oakridgensis]|uniref:Peptidase metallopeptidase n=1 Tax=Solidesulfovibrio carbinoliphilus subsp. oakridgensis TaxID=694327 RepID=G7QB43_9BACT|nr:peptidase [Solidesulfovibrio carbinoliphilus]EHJ48785.1 peptidase metallopeptidase [Solidesulfovibrio carbinoliphilus subsp. oakridgensis]
MATTYASLLEYDQSVYFNASQYETNKASYNNAHAVNGITNWTASSVDAVFQSVGLTPLQHYEKYGAFEDVNPSDLFDTSSYYSSKASQLTATTGSTWTSTQVESVFQQSDIDPITHYALYGASEDVFPTTNFASLKVTYTNADAIAASNDNRVDSLVTTTAWLFEQPTSWNWNDLASTQSNTLYYMFPTSADTVQSQGFSAANLSQFAGFNQNQKAGAVEALTELSKITGITFVETTDANLANIYMFGSDIGNDVAGLADAGTQRYKITVAVNSTYSTTADLRSGTGDHELIEHELGHALDMKHPFQGSVQLPTAQDNNNYTVMSYTAPSDTWYSVSSSIYGPYDIAALQYMYGTDGLGGNQGFVKVG